MKTNLEKWTENLEMIEDKALFEKIAAAYFKFRTRNFKKIMNNKK